MNGLGYYNQANLIRDETLKIDGNEVKDNGEMDDGGDKLGQCEGFEISGEEVYVTGRSKPRWSRGSVPSSHARGQWFKP